ncbi:translesion DNA synthesis-associated protein ImuA [Lysobacter sp. ESA13C]|uniref:translesion DNA synthesis-associated protein ImuA n=1 Tax=Lysobacter sp. ESA13C TaxID=2862676 RepID=UPI001CBB41E5|nr:translesion DNA synthesis-associated protein ImuA [Lysobacter sp. ESA13C]
MGQVVALTDLITSQRVWRGAVPTAPSSAQPTGLAELDAGLPTGGWPEASLVEILIPSDGMGELDLLIPTLCRLTSAGQLLALISPPYIPYAPAFQSRGIALARMHVVRAAPKLALWAAEQCLRSGAFGAVLMWPQKIDHHGLRRLQVAADTGRTLGFAFRPLRCGSNPSPAPLRLEIGVHRSLRVAKCRGGVAPHRSFAIPAHE